MVRFLKNDPDIAGNLLPGPTNGATYYVGLAGVSADGVLQFTAFASANQVLSVASSCAVTIADLHAGGRLGGYLPPPTQGEAK